MKRQIIKMMALIAILFSGVITLHAQEIQIPFTEKKYTSDENFFRATSSGKSPDMAMAQSIAEANAKRSLAGQIETKIMSVMEIYTLQTELVSESQSGMDFGREVTEITKSVVNQVLKDVHIMAQQPVRVGNIIEYYMVLEMPKKKVVEQMELTITKEGFNLEKEKFEEIFDEEMSKYGKENE